MSWSTQPICGACWQAYSYGKNGELIEPVKMVDPELEVCCFCGGWAEQGIYLRVETEKVPFANVSVEARRRILGEN